MQCSARTATLIHPSPCHPLRAPGKIEGMTIVLLVSPTCSACPSAKQLFKQLRSKYSFHYREVDITTPDGQELAQRHAVRAVPATILDGRLTFVGVPSRQSGEKAFDLRLKARSA